MNRIIPHLWYDKEAKEAALFYISLFKGSKLLGTSIIKDTPSGDAEMVDFKLAGQPFAAISAGPYFKHNPSISLYVACENEAETDALWKALSVDGTELMPLGEYPFNRHYGWVQDRYGLSWQLMTDENRAKSRKITPNLLFSGDVCGRAEEAARFYMSVFENAKLVTLSRYAPGEAALPEAKVNYLEFIINDMAFSAMDNGYTAEFGFNEAFSFIVKCETQEEIDYYWDKLSAVPESEQCGWLKDKFGVSWQIAPAMVDAYLTSGTEEEISRVMQAFLQMKKVDLAALEKARKGIE